MERVDAPPAVTVCGLNVAVAPAGTPLALSAIVCAEPLTTAVEMVDVTVPPAVVATLPGLAASEKSSGAETLRVSVVECVAELPVPVTVTAYPPAGVAAFVAMERVAAPPAVTPDGLNVAVAPAGRPLALRAIVCAEPLTTAVEIVDVTAPPGPVVTLPGLALIEKSSAGADPPKL